MLKELTKIKKAKTGRCSSWDTTGKNDDRWFIKPGESAVLADIEGPGCITHIWMAQRNHYRECLLKITWDNAKAPSVVVPLGDFFGLGHGIVNSYQSLLFNASVSADHNNRFNQDSALNSYVQMPFKTRAVVELVNESQEEHLQYFYIDYETYDEAQKESGYFHAEWRRENPFGGWGHEIPPGAVESEIANKGRTAWENNYVILETKGRGHYIGCNISISNFKCRWWGEGDDMIWVDGYKWPPDLHGTGTEDYLSQAWGMQDNAFLRNGSSIFEQNTMSGRSLWDSRNGGYQTSYVFHIENPIYFEKEIKVTVEHGHGNHQRNEISSTAYWYAEKPGNVKDVPPVAKRMPVLQDNQGHWLYDKKNQTTSKVIKLSGDMLRAKKKWQKQEGQ